MQNKLGLPHVCLIKTDCYYIFSRRFKDACQAAIIFHLTYPTNKINILRILKWLNYGG